MTNCSSSAPQNTPEIYKHPWYIQQQLLENTTTSDVELTQKLRPEVTGPRFTEETSYCFACDQELPKSSFCRNASRTAGVQRQCKSCQDKYKSLRAEHQMPEGQICECCGVRPASCFDHDKKTMIFRGWLCRGCNSGIGMLDHDVGRMGLSINYLSTRV